MSSIITIDAVEKYNFMLQSFQDRAANMNKGELRLFAALLLTYRIFFFRLKYKNYAKMTIKVFNIFFLF